MISCFNDQVNELLALLSNKVNDLNVETGSISLGLSNSTNLIVEDESVDAVITSPPYCTRIDYAVLTSLELALLGINDDDLATLRRTLIGSPLTHPTEPEINVDWRNLCLTTINRIKRHESKASDTYYLRTYLQYFDGLYKSLIEIDRVLTSNGKCVIVVQDSYYKDIHININLAEIVSEMATSLNWKHTKQLSYTSKQSMSWINTNSKKYRNITKDKETVLFFQKELNDMTKESKVSPAELIQIVDSKIDLVKTRTLDLSFNELLDMYEDDELEISPEYQRLFRWSEEKQSRFIESLILEMPIPPIFVIEVKDGIYE
ncbi:DUF262 domain-containing protein [Pseudogracilibacillus sp. SO30301A]|uniref:DUF262 domain-containing protein n=1 Tax=Pseudogracilibacillus sp. SO30301A TaxID=3098291 RepID=UPI00300E57C1